MHPCHWSTYADWSDGTDGWLMTTTWWLQTKKSFVRKKNRSIINTLFIHNAAESKAQCTAVKWEGVGRMKRTGLLVPSVDPCPAVSAPVWYELSQDYGCSEPKAMRDQACFALTLTVTRQEQLAWINQYTRIDHKKMSIKDWLCYIMDQNTKYVSGAAIVNFGC